MAADHFGEGALQRGHVQRAFQEERGGHVVLHAAGFELVDEPEALLGEGERRAACPHHRTQRRQGGAVSGLLHSEGERSEGGSLEEGPQGQLDVEGLAHARDDLGGQQRVAAQREEVVVAADLLHAQHLGPQGGQLLLGRRGGGFVGSSGGGGLRSGKGLAVHLSVGSEGEGVQGDEDAGHHVLGQPLLESGAQGGGVGCGLVVGEPGHQARVAGHVLAHEDEGLAHARKLSEGGFDFTQLDAEATQLHLEVGAAQVVEGAVGQPAHLVAGAVHASAGGGAEGVGQEALCGEGGAAQVATGEARAGDEELSGHADGHGPQLPIQHVDVDVGQRHTNGGARLGAHGEGSGVHRALGGAVDVEGARTRRGGKLLPEGLVNGLTAGHQQARGGLVAQQAFLHQQPKQGRGAVEHVNALALQPLAQGVCILPGGVGNDAQAVAVEQLHQLLDGAVKGQRRIDADAQAGGLPRVDGASQGVAQVEDGAVLHHDALGRAGTARGVDDVGEVAGGGRGRGVVSGQRGGQRFRRVEAQHLRALGRSPDARQSLLGEEDGGRAVQEGEVEALRGPGRVQRDVAAACFHDAEQGDHHVDGALEAEGHGDVGADAERAQVPGQLVGARVELVEGEDGVLEADGGGVGRARGLELEGVVEAGVDGNIRGGLVPTAQHLLTLGGGQQGQLGKALLRIGGDGLQQHLEVPNQTRGGGLREEIHVALQRAREALECFDEVEVELELGHPTTSDIQGPERQGGQVHFLRRGVLQGKERLEERCAAQVPRRVELLHQLLEGHVLVLVGAQGGLTHLPQQLEEGQTAFSASAQHEGVDEEADEAFGLRMTAAGDGGADDDVLLAGIAGEQHLEGGQQQHEGRGALALGQGLEGLAQIAGKAHRHRGAPVGEDRRAGEVGGQLQVRRRTRELLLPPAQLPVEGRTLEPPALPDGVVGVLHWQFGQWRGLARAEGLVEGHDFAHQHAGRPAVGDDVVQVQEQRVLVLSQA